MSFGLLVGFQGTTQVDAVYSQLNNSLITINPATAGVFYGGFRMVSNYRTVYSTVANPYVNMQVSFDKPVHDNIWENDFIAVGFTVSSDQSGPSSFLNNSAMIMVSYGKALDPREHHFFTVGFSGGGSQKSLTIEGLNWESQFDRVGFDQTLPSGESFVTGAGSGVQAMHLDFGMGFNYVYNNESTLMIKTGAGLQHVNKPTYEFFGQDLSVYRRITFHADLKAKPSGSTLSFWPKALYSIQGPHQVFFIGTDLHYLLQEAGNITGSVKEISFAIGPYYRHREGASLQTRFQIGGLHLGLAYDFNLNKLNTASNRLGGPEMLLSYQSGFKKGRHEKHNHKRFEWRYD